MADRVRKISYTYVTVPNRAGQGERILRVLKDAGVNLLAFTAFPDKPRKSQIDLVADDMATLRRVARKNGWSLSKPKKGFHVQGEDRAGAVHRHVSKLAAENINVTAAEALCAGKGRYGMILWVKPGDYSRAAKVLGAN